MRVLFTVSDWRGHYFCMVPLGWALQAAGHEVRVACTEGQRVPVSAAGLVPVPVLDSLDMPTMVRMMNYAEAVEGRRTAPGLPLHPYTGRPVRSLADFDVETEAERFWARSDAAVRRSYDGAVELARDWRPDLVVHDLMTPEGALAAMLTGVPSVYHPPGLFGTVETEPGVDLGDGDPSGSFPRYGREPWSGTQIEYVIDTSPTAAAPPTGKARRLPERYVPYNGPGALPDWLARPPERPRVSVLWGNSSGAEADSVPALRAAIGALLDEGAEIVLTTGSGQADAIGELPAEVRVLRNFPLRLLLATCTAAVHHGSVNGLMTAAALGVPQLALALNDEQYTVSTRMARTGAVVALRGLRAEPERVRAGALEVLTGQRPTGAARAVCAELAAKPSPARLVKTLETLARTGGLDAPDVAAL